MADRLATLARLRRLQAVQAGRDLTESLAGARRAAHAQTEAAAAIVQQQAAAPADVAHPLAGGFAAWLPAGVACLTAAALSHRAAEAHAAASRAALAEARAAECAVQTLRDAHATAARHAAGRRAQTVLDDWKKPGD